MKLTRYERLLTKRALDHFAAKEYEKKRLRSAAEGRYEAVLVEQAYREAGTWRDGSLPLLMGPRLNGLAH